ncbi:MAG: glutamate 5-kinase, partial [Gammaproteobacteria bacterium]|nr:glutamate 5-kinase [Gammaproteobacteria bacterium]
MNESRKKIKQTKRWVVKLGSALLTDEGCGLRVDSLDAWVKQIHALRQKGHEIVIVSSGATAEGITRLGWKKRPHAVHELQAAAAVGQMGLIKAWESCFQNYQIHTAQILLTHEVISNRERYLNARSTLRTLLQLGVVPIVNENDTVSTDELRFGDNDTLAGLVTHLVDADLLVLLTDQEGLYEADPNLHPQAKYISEAIAGDKTLEKYAGEGGALGRGGMLTKLKAASMAAKSGTSTIIASGQRDDVLMQIANGER